MKYFDNNSFVPRTIQADSPLYRSRIKSLPRNKDTQERLKLYNLIKSDPNAVFTFYHGTSESIWEAIQKKGYFTSPRIQNMEQRENRKRGLEEVFFTTSVDYADEYAKRAERQTKTKGIILELRIPIYYCKEVSSLILGTENVEQIYNEYKIPYKINEIIENKQIDLKQKAEAIKKFFIDKIEEKSSDEFTIKHAVPVKFVVGNSNTSINLWNRWILENPQKYKKASELFPNNEQEFYEAYKQGYLELVKNNPKVDYEKAIKLFPNDKKLFDNALRQGYIKLVEKYPFMEYLNAVKLFPYDEGVFHEARKRGFLKWVKKYPSYYHEAIKLFPNDKELFYEAYKQGYLKLVQESKDDDYNKNLAVYEDAIKLFPNDKGLFDEARKKGLLNMIQREPVRYLRLKALFPEYEEEFYKTAKKSCIEMISEHEYHYGFSKRLFPNDRDIFQAGKRKYLELLINSHVPYAYARLDFPNDPDIYEAGKQQYLYIVKNNPTSYYEEAVKLFPEAKHDFDIAAGKIPQEQPTQACGWYRRIKY